MGKDDLPHRPTGWNRNRADGCCFDSPDGRHRRHLHTPRSRHLHTPRSRHLHTLRSRHLHTLCSRHLHTLCSRHLHTLRSRHLHTLCSRHLHTPRSRLIRTLSFSFLLAAISFWTGPSSAGADEPNRARRDDEPIITRPGEGEDLERPERPEAPEAPEGSESKKTETLSWELEIDTSVGFDSNPTRVEPCLLEQPKPSAFMLGSLSVDTTWKPSSTDRIELDLLAGGKIHLSEHAKGEDVYKHRAAFSWTHVMDGHGAVALRGLYFESWERTLRTGSGAPSGEESIAPPELQDFRYSRAEAVYVAPLTQSIIGSATLSAVRFDYRPEKTLSFNGLGAGAGLRYRRSWGPVASPSQLDLTGSYHVENHLYPGSDRSEGTSDPRRHDLLHTVFVESAYVGTFLASLSYTLKANVSNDTAWTVIRHTVTGKGAVSLPWSIVAVSKVTYQHLDYPRALLVYAPTSPEPFQQLDEESRSSVLLSLQREFGKTYGINLSYKLYLGRAGAACSSAYLRHLALVELAVRH